MDEGDRPGGAVDRFLADLAVWMAEDRARGAAEARAKRRWLEQQAAEEATFTGLAIDLAERQLPVAVRTSDRKSVV